MNAVENYMPELEQHKRGRLILLWEELDGALQKKQYLS
jgi:hypothetical protein